MLVVIVLQLSVELRKILFFYNTLRALATGLESGEYVLNLVDIRSSEQLEVNFLRDKHVTRRLREVCKNSSAFRVKLTLIGLPYNFSLLNVSFPRLTLCHRSS